MKYNVYSYRDNKVGFGNPICDLSDETAIRGFSYAMNNKDGLMNFSPKDFDLYKIGVFDTNSGFFSSEPVPVLVCSGVNVIGV